MKRIIIRDHAHIAPFDEPARDLRILNKPLWLLQHDLLKPHCKGERNVESLAEVADLPPSDEELFIHKDNLFFNEDLVNTFIAHARAAGRACQIAFLATSADGKRRGDRMIEAHGLHLQEGIRRADDVLYRKDGAEARGDVYVADVYYYPPGQRAEPQPLVIDTDPAEMGYYHIPSYMAKQGDLVYQIPLRAFLSIENWVHIFLANTPMGVFAWGRSHEARMIRGRLKDFRRWTREDWRAFFGKVMFSTRAFIERINPFEDRWRNHFLASRALVKVGKNCSIDPTAVIHGPTIIGDNVYIGPGTVIANSLIGNNVNVMQGSQVMLSVVSDRCFLPFNAGLFMTTLMDNTMVAQNSTLQLCVVGRNTFIGANNCFTDFNLQGEPIRTPHKGQLVDVKMPVLGSAVGHNCKIGSGFVIYPGRLIGSGAVIIFNNDASLIRKGVPGVSPDDIDEQTAEPRRIIYHWPNVYNPDAAHARDEASPDGQNGAQLPPTLEMTRGNSPAVRAHTTLRRIDL